MSLDSGNALEGDGLNKAIPVCSLNLYISKMEKYYHDYRSYCRGAA